MTDTQRIQDLEDRAAFQERALEQLNRIVADQQLELDDVRRELKELRSKVRTQGGTDDAAEARDLKDDQPPHY